MKNSIKNNSRKNNDGFSLIVAIVITSMLLLVSYVIINVAAKELVLSQSGKDSQYAFYNARNGIECAMYWDLNNSGTYASAFSITTVGTISCNSQSVSTNSQTVPTIPGIPSRIGGGGAGNPMSIFSINYPQGCDIVRVTKNLNNTTTIDSRGYNTCDTSSSRRFERGITITY